MKKKLFSIALAAVVTVSMGLIAAACEDPGSQNGGGGGGNTPTKAIEIPTFGQQSNASVHDPSVFQDPADGKFYVFGSHYAVASSYDLVEWEQEVGDKGWSQLYGTAAYTKNGIQWPRALQETVDTVTPSATKENTIDTTWAPDVEYYNGKYYMYYSLTKAFGSRESVIGRVESDNVLGPYDNNVIIVSSMGGSGSAPNCIDPELFYDKDGKLWMTYGSAAGGIYIKELYNSGDNWGLPKEDGFGKNLWNGGNNQEGPFIFYNSDFDYYYLIVSYGSLSSSYNMRVARSKAPDGPYVDITNTDVSTVVQAGNKIAGNFVVEGKGVGVAAIGHNSVVKVDGEYFSVAHARSGSSGSGVGSGHSLLVQQIYFNKDGWPVFSPSRYVYEQKGLVTQEQAAGDYDVVLHTEGTTATFAQSKVYTFAADGTITDAADASAGSWTVTDDYYVEITLDGVTYNGVICPGWREYYNNVNDYHGVINMTAVSDEGRSLWVIGKTEPAL